jgi:hypothetical protein
MCNFYSILQKEALSTKWYILTIVLYTTLRTWDISLDIFSMIRFFSLKKALLECRVNYFSITLQKANHMTGSDWNGLDWLEWCTSLHQMRPSPNHTIPCQSKPSLAQFNTTQLSQPHAALSCEARVCSASQEVSCTFWNSKVHYGVQKS